MGSISARNDSPNGVRKQVCDLGNSGETGPLNARTHPKRLPKDLGTSVAKQGGNRTLIPRSPMVMILGLGESMIKTDNNKRVNR